MGIPDSVVDSFGELFKGRTDVWGSVEGKANKEPVTHLKYRWHLEGKESLGIYPLLEDGLCHFFAIDIDVKDVQLAVKIRRAFLEFKILVYIAESKSKGYHIYGFMDKATAAADVRYLSMRILSKLQIKAEIFPKQDKLDGTTPFGNYINIPCCGQRRPFIEVKNFTPVPTEIAIARIKRIDPTEIAAAIKSFPPVQPNIVTVGKLPRQKKGQSPPCIEAIFKGVSAGMRDVAAFALSRHLLDQGKTPEEVLGLLIVWDGKNNKPPLNDQKLLDTKVRSAAKGYAFGCASIKDESLLAHLCPGDCDWLHKNLKDMIKKGQIRIASFFQDEGHLYEEIVKGEQSSFACYDRATGQVSRVDKITTDCFEVLPVAATGKEITEQAVTFPMGIAEYGDVNSLVADLRTTIHTYMDIGALEEEFAAWYVLMSWVYDRLDTLPYLRFIGDTGTGKSRGSDIVGRLCYKPMILAAAINPAPIYRMIDRFRGTLLIDEASFAGLKSSKDTSESSEIITILNAGFERGRPIIRCVKDDPSQFEILPCFGPKVFAVRFEFEDTALESRCITIVMEETDRMDIRPVLLPEDRAKLAALREKLLLFRLRNYDKVHPETMLSIDLGPLEPRLKQLGLPFAVIFKDYPEVLKNFRDFMQRYQVKIRQKRSDSASGRVVMAVFKLALEHGRDNVNTTMVTDCLKEDFKLDINSRTTGRILNVLKIERAIRRIPGSSRAHYITWESSVMSKLMRRYILPIDMEEYKFLLSGDGQQPVKYLEETLDLEV